MEINFLGSGSAFVLGNENYNSNIIISNNGKNLLYDCGITIPEALDTQGLKPQDIDAIYISHLHADHAGGIEYIAYKTFFETYKFRKEVGEMKPLLYGYHETIKDGWEKTWSGGLQCIQNKYMQLDDYFEVSLLNEEDSFNFEGIEISHFRTNHVSVNNEVALPSYGLFLVHNNKKVLISGDTKMPLIEEMELYSKADIIFHEIEFAEYPNPVHTQYYEALIGFHSHIKSKMYLYHYSLNGKDFDEINRIVQEDGFAGLIKRGHKFKF
jgi:ribonuclease BN (tRNA processing enzyme)